MSDSITWTCCVCGKAVANKRGYLEIDYVDINEYQRLKQQWETENPGPMISASACWTYPDEPRWRVLHRACDPCPDSETMYWLAVERVRTECQLIDWTAHLLEKTWLPDTNWRELLIDAILPRVGTSAGREKVL